PKEPESRPEGAEIPVLAEIEPLISNAKERAVYLFAIDEKAYYMVEIGAEEEVKLPENGSLEWKGTQHMRSMEPMHQAFAAITATQIWRWRESRRFCGHCGARMTESTVERALVCPECGQTEYPKISPAVIVAITDGDRLLMSRYRDRPYRGYALIAGFVEIGESFEDTIRREVMEEVGLKVKNIRYFGSQPWAFTDTEMIGFFAELDGDGTIRLQEDELSEAGWYHRDEIPDDELRISVGSEMKMAFKYGTWK
ncbi:MAG: NAD(+) diphosphatase, partial [Clostridium sp.]|nr:NAD(+) diphosphatase [Clostridium sp.]